MPKTARSWRTQQRRSRCLRAGLLSLTALAFALPLLWTLLASFGVQPVTPPWGWMLPPVFEHYQEIGIAEPNFWQALVTSAGIATVATLLTITIAFLAAYSLARSHSRHHHLVVQSLLILASLPVLAYVVPLSDIMRRLHLQDTVTGITLAQTAAYVSLATYILFGYLAHLNREPEEAALLEGATLPRRLLAVILPLAAPSVIATSIIIFVLHWNTLLTPLVLTTGNVKTLPVVMVDFFTFERELTWSTAAAALVTSLLPLTLLVGLAYRSLAGFGLTTEHDGQASVK